MSKKQIKSIPCPSCISFVLCKSNNLYDRETVNFEKLVGCPIFYLWFYQDLNKMKDIQQITAVYKVPSIKWS